MKKEEVRIGTIYERISGPEHTHYRSYVYDIDDKYGLVKEIPLFSTYCWAVVGMPRQFKLTNASWMGLCEVIK